MYCQRIALFVAIFGSLLSSQINGSTLPPPVDEITNKTTIAPNGAIKTAAQLKEVCETLFEYSRWINDRCYFFHNKEVRAFDDAQKICSVIGKQHGFENGRIYEPKDSENFVKIYKLAEEFSKRPTLQLWLGLNDREKDGEFVYNSNGKLPKIKEHWADRQPNGGLAENCLTTFMPDDDDSPRLYDRPCVETDPIGETGHKFFCECNVPDQKQTHKETMVEDAISKDHLNVSEARADLMSDIKDCKGGACLSPANNENMNSKILETKVKKADMKSTETSSKTDPIETNATLSAININKSTVDHLNVSDARANLMDEIKTCGGGKCLKSADSGSKDSTATQKKVVPSSSPLKDDSNEKKVYMCECVQFHGWSFFGGIVVTIGTAAIAFLGIKYYKTKKMQNPNYNLF